MPKPRRDVPIGGLSDAAKRFLADHVASLERVDVLLLMHRQAGRWWTAQEVSVAVTMSPETAQSHLDVLGTLNLLDVRIAESLIYRYQPGSPELIPLVDEIARAYYADRHAVVAVLPRRPSEGVRFFAEAFRLRKDTPDG